MEVVKSELNKILSNYGRSEGIDLQLALANIYQYKLEGLVTNKLTLKVMTALDQGLKRDRTEIIFGLRTHDTIIAALAESHGYQASNFFGALNLLVKNGKIMSDGLKDMVARKNSIRSQIPAKAVMAPAAPAPVSGGAVFTVALPI